MTGVNDNNKLYAIGYRSRWPALRLSNSRYDYAGPTIDHSLMKRSSDTFAEFLPRSSIIHRWHTLDSSIFHRGRPASIQYRGRLHQPVITGRICESVRTNINLDLNNVRFNHIWRPRYYFRRIFSIFFSDLLDRSHCQWQNSLRERGNLSR